MWAFYFYVSKPHAVLWDFRNYQQKSDKNCSNSACPSYISLHVSYIFPIKFCSFNLCALDLRMFVLLILQKLLDSIPQYAQYVITCTREVAIKDKTEKVKSWGIYLKTAKIKNSNASFYCSSPLPFST